MGKTAGVLHILPLRIAVYIKKWDKNVIIAIFIILKIEKILLHKIKRL